MTRHLALLFTLLYLVRVSRCSACSAPFPRTSSDPAEFTGPFDYVIVGGGTAGLVVASRLTDDANVHVGVIEAGVYHGNDPLIDVPANVGMAAGNPNYDWNFLSTETPGADNREISQTRGKMIGGSTGLNIMAWTRASKDEYDAWQTLTGDSQWSWDGLLPFFQKSEAVFADESSHFPQTSAASYDPAFVNFDGPVSASFNSFYSDPFPVYQQTFASFGVPVNTSPDNGTTAGMMNSRSDVDRPTGTRAYAAHAYYCRFGSRRNFHVLTNAQATKVLTKSTKSGLVATGVQYSSGSQTYVVNATREVILSAGAFKTPQLLELSGIGNQTLLKSLGIKTLIDLPEVGENLQDHVFGASQFSVKPGVLTFDQLRINKTFMTLQQEIYNQSGGGLLAGTDTALGFLPFQMFLSPSQVSTLLVQFDEAVAQSSRTPLLEAQFAIQRQWIESGRVPQAETIMWSKGIIDPAANQSYITLLSGGLHHTARGSAHINSTDGLEQPRIDLDWLASDFDVNTITQVFEFSQKVPLTAPLSHLIVGQTAPPAGMQTGAGLESWIRETAVSASHPMGTVAMARRELGGVLDTDLKVYGTQNLRVCDASVFPIGVGTHLQSTVYAVAEKLSDMMTRESS